MKIILGSNSSLKQAALVKALKRLNVDAHISSTATRSGVSEQPVGPEETARGAHNRARAAQAQAPRSFAIGIENGIRETAQGHEDWAVVVVLRPDGNEARAESAAVPFPSSAVEEARTRGFNTTTVGQVLAEQTGCDAADPHSFLTGGRTSRLALLTEAVTEALRLALL